MDTSGHAVGLLKEVNVEEIIGRYRNSVTQNNQEHNMQEVRLLLTQTRYEKENHGDRAALIVTNLASGALLFKGIIDDKWYFYDDLETRDPALSTRPQCSLGIPDIDAESYDGHYFEFGNEGDYARFRDFLLGGQELSKIFQRAWHETLITSVLENSGGHRLDIAE